MLQVFMDLIFHFTAKKATKKEKLQTIWFDTKVGFAMKKLSNLSPQDA
jgi:hypothetical protein